MKASVVSHTTASFPRPHVVYVVEVTKDDGESYRITKRYSDFATLKAELRDSFAFPPKRILTTTFLPSAWVDDKLIAERTTGLTAYLDHVLSGEITPAVAAFIAPFTGVVTGGAFHAEDALPSTMSRKDATALASSDGVEAAAQTFVAGSYYPDWAVDTNPPENIDYSRFDILFFAFVTPSSSNGLSWDDGSQDTLKRLVAAAKKSGHGTKIVLSVGGWGGCQYFHQAMSSSANRGVFIAALAAAVSQYGLAGVDIDWEYPNDPGAGQPYGSADSANFLTFVTYLRKSLGSSAIISGTAPDTVWKGSNGNPLTSGLAAYAAQMTYVNIMNYDVWGSSSTPGPNAPLSNACGTSSQPADSAQAALNQWTKAGFPANKLLLGLPTYGYVSQSTATHLSGSYRLPGPGLTAPTNAHTERVLAAGGVAGPSDDVEVSIPEGETAPEPAAGPKYLNGAHDRSFEKAMASKRVHGPIPEATAGNLSSYENQQIPFNQIVALGALKKSGGAYNGTNGYTEGWDNCSDTPFLFNTSRKTVVTYDDTYSLGDKAAFAKSNGMAGCFTWSLDQDDGYTLQNAVRSALGKS